MATLAEIREKYPQYADVPDEALAKGLHAKHYSQMPFEEFAAKIGLQTIAAPEPTLGDRAKQALGLTPVGIGMQLAPKLAAGIRGDAAEELPSAVGSEGYRDARWAEMQRKPYLEGVKQEGREFGATVFGGDEELAQVMADAVPGSKITQDANGNAVIELPSGERVYPNKPGLDSQDVLRTGANIASYLPAVRTARAISGGSTVLRAGATGALSAATNAAGQKAAGREDIDGGEVAVAGGFGAGGELLAPIAGLVVKAIKNNPARGNARAFEILKRDLGIEQPTNAQVATMARGLDEIEAGADPAAVLGADEFGFIYTKGRRMAEGQKGKFEALTDEEALRQAPGYPGNQMRGIDQSNRQTLETVLGRQLDQVGGVNRPQSPVGAFERIGETAKAQADELDGRVSAAYDKAAQGNRTSVSADAVRQAPDRIKRALREFPVGDLTPATRDILARLRFSAEGMTPGTKGVTLRAIEDQRKLINNAFGAAANSTDRNALRVLKGEYDRWLDDAFDNALISGDEQALAAMKEARGLRAEYGRRFEGDNADVDKFVQAMIGGDKTPDELIGVALGSSQVSKAGAARFVERLKVATNNDPEVLGALKAAHLMRLTQAKTGETLGMQAVRANILAAEQNTPSVLRSLYAPGEWAQIKRLATAIDPLLDKGTFARRPGTADQIARMLGSLPFVGKAVEMTQTPLNAWKAAGVAGPLARRPVGPELLPAGAAAAGDGR